MTSLELFLARHDLKRAVEQSIEREQTVIMDGVIAMKTLLIGLLFGASFGPWVVAEVDPDAEFTRQMTYALMGGTLGTLVFLCITTQISNITQMARLAFGNCFSAVLFGPAASYVVCKTTGLSMSMAVIVPTSGVLGICGSALVIASVPIVQSAWSKWVQKKSDDLTDGR